MDVIKEVWFDNNRIFVRLDGDIVYNRPLEAFPTLLEASDEEREKYEINKYGDALRWRTLDEDIHVSSFKETKEPNTDNEVARILRKFPWLNYAALAKAMNVHKSLLLRYFYGMVEPSAERMSLLKDTLHIMGKEMLSA